MSNSLESAGASVSVSSTADKTPEVRIDACFVGHAVLEVAAVLHALRHQCSRIEDEEVDDVEATVAQMRQALRLAEHRLKEYGRLMLPCTIAVPPHAHSQAEALRRLELATRGDL